eukprot:3454531-Pyramimonas_sp.AAC.1
MQQELKQLMDAQINSITAAPFSDTNQPLPDVLIDKRMASSLSKPPRPIKSLSIVTFGAPSSASVSNSVLEEQRHPYWTWPNYQTGTASQTRQSSPYRARSPSMQLLSDH